MTLSLSNKLTLSVLALCVLCTALVWLSTRLFFQSYFLDYVNQREEARMIQPAGRLADYYAQSNSWQGMRDNPSLWRQIAFDDPANPSPRSPPPPSTDEAAQGLLPGTRHNLGAALVDSSRAFVAGDSSLVSSTELLSAPIVFENREVGYLLGRKQIELTEAIDQNFARSLNQSTLWALTAIVALSLLVSALLVRNLSRPIRRLSRGTHKLTKGRYHERISINRSDELGQLAKDFNTLAETLDSNKQNQQRWIADISHELRTPLAVLKGEIMAIEDGIRHFDQASLSSLSSETDRLSRMVNDLYDLSRADTGDLDYDMEEINLIDTLEEVVSKFSPRYDEKRIQLSLVTKKPAISVIADSDRVIQLFSNLLENSLRYTDPEGKTTIRCAVENSCALVIVEDTEPGISRIECEKIFDRLYRVEASRSRKYGGGGLGLALCRSIVEAHKGSISAENSSEGGLKIIVSLPLGTSS